MNQATPSRLVRLPEVMGLVALGKTSVYLAIRQGSFPAPVHIASRAVAWREADILKWIETRQATAKS